MAIGLVQKSAATWRCAAFISWTRWTLAMQCMTAAP